MVETALLCGSTLFGFHLWLKWSERRDLRRFEQRTKHFELRSASADAKTLDLLQQRVRALELKGLR